MRLEHLNLVVEDIEKSLEFYRAAFPHWRVRSEGKSDWYGKPRRWLHFGDDYNYLAFADNGVGNNRNLKGHDSGLAHFCFETNDIASLIMRLEKAGFVISNTGAVNQFRKNVYFIDPDGFEVEFVEYLSDIPNERNKND